MTKQSHIPFRQILIGTGIVSLVPPVYQLLSFYILGIPNCTLGTLWENIAWTWLFSALVTALLFIANIFIQIKGHKYLGHLGDTRRILISVTLSLLFSNIIIYGFWILFDNMVLQLPEEGSRARIFSNQILATVLVLIVDLIMEISTYMQKLKLSIARQEKMEKEMMRAQLEGLKTQISPHFLFNSFNALQSLVDQNPAQAKAFIQELSRVYRYVLDKKDAMVVPCGDEIAFIKSYLYLNQIRFGDSLIFEIDDDDCAGYLPPLTLQILIENAIKHNVISRSKPLHIQIKKEQDALMVINNLQLRDDAPHSTGIGHQNILARYALLSTHQPDFGVNGAYYIAKVPILAEEQ